MISKDCIFSPPEYIIRLYYIRCSTDRERGEVFAPRERDDATETQSQTVVVGRRSYWVVRCCRRTEWWVR